MMYRPSGPADHLHAAKSIYIYKACSADQTLALLSHRGKWTHCIAGNRISSPCENTSENGASPGGCEAAGACVSQPGKGALPGDMHREGE